MFNVKNIEVIFGHLFHRMYSHIVLLQPNLIPYSLYDSSRHDLNLPA